MHAGVPWFKPRPVLVGLGMISAWNPGEALLLPVSADYTKLDGPIDLPQYEAVSCIPNKT